MGILADFNNRKDRQRQRKRLKKTVKHRLRRIPNVVNSSINYSIMKLSTKKKKFPTATLSVTSFQARNSPESVDRKIEIKATTLSIIRYEFLDLLHSASNQKCTVLAMANALAQSQSCLESHSKVNNEGNRFLPLLFKFPGRSKKFEKESMRLRYELIGAFNWLEKHPSSRNKVVSSWEEAKKCLENVLCFPNDHTPAALEIKNSHDSGIQSDSRSIAKKHEEFLEVETEKIKEIANNSPVTNMKWKQIASYPDEQRYVDKVRIKRHEIEEGEYLDTLIRKESIDKADLHFNARIQTADELEKQLRKKVAVEEFVTELEERIKTEEAERRASSLMRLFNEEEQEIIRDAIYGYGHDEEIVAQSGTDSVQRASMQTLKPGEWLNDEIIHHFYLMLSKRDEELCMNDPTRQRSHFFKSFFITKVLNEGNASCDGKYEYRNVKRWSKKVPGKDIFKLDKILFPINMGNMHWIAAVIFMKKKRIEIFDSMGSDGGRYLEALFSYIQDEHMDKKKIPLPDADAWELIPTQQETPRQRNGHDCGVFTCMFADFLSKDTSLVFNQNHINQCRERIALSIMKGKAIV